MNDLTAVKKINNILDKLSICAAERVMSFVVEGRREREVDRIKASFDKPAPCTQGVEA